MPAHSLTYLSESDWRDEGKRRFGDDVMRWLFVCPACGHVACPTDWLSVGAPEGAVGFACVGRWLDKKRGAFEDGIGPCDYTGGGLIGLNPMVVNTGDRALYLFAFAEVTGD